jgi:hypothetical protein
MFSSTLINGSNLLGVRKLKSQTRSNLGGKWAIASQCGVDLFTPRPVISLLILLAKMLRKSIHCSPQSKKLIIIFG